MTNNRRTKFNWRLGDGNGDGDGIGIGDGAKTKISNCSGHKLDLEKGRSGQS